MGAVAFAYWLNAAAYGPDSFARAQAALAHPLGRLVLLGFTFALFFHLLNGIRHLFWDAGWGFELSQVSVSGWTVVLGAIVLTLLAWFAGYGALGGG